MKQGHTAMDQISIRLEPATSERADVVAAALAGRAEFKAFRMSRAAVLRMAMLEGLAVLEQRYTSNAHEGPVAVRSRAKGR